MLFAEMLHCDFSSFGHTFDHHSFGFVLFEFLDAVFVPLRKLFLEFEHPTPQAKQGYVG